MKTFKINLQNIDFPNGFCLLNNIAISIESLMKEMGLEKVLVLDWDVHHGNGTEHIFYERSDVYTISIHQERHPYQKIFYF